MNCHYQPVNRLGLYILVFIILLSSCSADRSIRRVEAKLDNYIVQQELIKQLGNK